jgi:hypothetical protein
MRLEGWTHRMRSRPSFETRVAAMQERRRYALLRMRSEIDSHALTMRPEIYSRALKFKERFVPSHAWLEIALPSAACAAASRAIGTL